jgi:polysaccharide deacetylase 2 family uncharacterized protein YibQ
MALKRKITTSTLLPPAFGLWAWCAACAVAALAVLSMCIILFFSGRQLSKSAVEAGQRVVVHVASGDVEGNGRHTPHAVVFDAPVASTSQPGKSSPVDDGKEALAEAPLSTLTEPSDRGLIPAAARDGTLAWKYYARPFTGTRPIIAIIFTDMGLSRPLTEEALSLPHPVDFSFSPYAGDSKKWAQKARAQGFEALIDLPLEPTNYPLSDPGPNGLLTELPSVEIEARLHWLLSRFSGFVGTLSFHEKMTVNNGAIRPVLNELTTRGLLFVYEKTPENATLAPFIKEHSFRALGADMVIDEEITRAAIDHQLQSLVDIARKQGYAIGIAHAYPPTIEAVTEWKDTLAAQGVELAPLSAIARKVYP